MELILHIGMGKTGTSSIQKALGENRERLRAQGVEYLGMFFDLLDSSIHNDDVQRNFFRNYAAGAADLAHRYASALAARKKTDGLSKFILSNESLLQQTQGFMEFVTELAKDIDIRIVMYARDPRDWLPSAYNQWFLSHKTNLGPIPPFRVGGPSLLSMYKDLIAWKKRFGDKAMVNKFSKSVNVVSDIAGWLDVTLPVHEERTQQRLEVSETVLRAVYNSRFHSQVSPERFNRALGNLSLGASLSLDRFLKDSLSYSEASSIVANHIEMFLEIEKISGVDLLGDPEPSHEDFDVESVRNRVLEHVLHIVMQQADRITQLEDALKRLNVTQP